MAVVATDFPTDDENVGHLLKECGSVAVSGSFYAAVKSFRDLPRSSFLAFLQVWSDCEL